MFKKIAKKIADNRMTIAALTVTNVAGVAITAGSAITSAALIRKAATECKYAGLTLRTGIPATDLKSTAGLSAAALASVYVTAGLISTYNDRASNLIHAAQAMDAERNAARDAYLEEVEGKIAE